MTTILAATTFDEVRIFFVEVDLKAKTAEIVEKLSPVDLATIDEVREVDWMAVERPRQNELDETVRSRFEMVWCGPFRPKHQMLIAPTRWRFEPGISDPMNFIYMAVYLCLGITLKELKGT